MLIYLNTYNFDFDIEINFQIFVYLKSFIILITFVKKFFIY